MKSLLFLLFASAIVLFTGLTLVDAGPNGKQTIPPKTEPIKQVVTLEPATIRSAAAAKPTQKPKPKISPALAAVLSNDFCSFYALRFDTEPTFLQSYLSTIGASPALQELFAPDGAYHGQGAHVSHKLAKFTLAIRLMHPGVYGETIAENLPRARDLLQQLENDDPKNAAFPYFRLFAEHRMKLPEEELARTAVKAAKGSYFNTLLLDEFDSVQGAYWENFSNHFLLNQIFKEMFPLPFHQTNEVMRKLDRKLSTSYASEVGELMVQTGSSARRSSEFLGYDEPTYSAGLSLSHEQHPGPNSLNLELNALRFSPVTPPIGGSVCVQSDLDEYLRELRTYL